MGHLGVGGGWCHYNDVDIFAICYCVKPVASFQKLSNESRRRLEEEDDDAILTIRLTTS